MTSAVDYSWGRPQPFPQSIKQAGFAGALRYVCAENSAKRISNAEAVQLKANGLSLGLVYEDEAAAPLQGYTRGVQNAQRAEAQANNVGFPADRPIFHAVDFDVLPGQYGSLDQYMAGVKSVSPRPYGWYGKYDLCERYGQQGVQYLWQCAAWSGMGNGSGGSIQGRRLSQFSCLFQLVGYVLGNTCDENVILRPDWGQNDYQGDDVLDQADKDFIVNAIRDTVRPAVLDTGAGKYIWDRGLPVPASDVQIQTIANQIGAPQVIPVNPGFVDEMRTGIGCINGGGNAAAIAAAIVDQLGDELAKDVLDAMSTRLQA